MSLIGPTTPAINDAIREAVANNIVVVTAAGNFRQDSCDFSPSSSPDVINVGAIQEAEDPNYGTRGTVCFNHVLIAICSLSCMKLLKHCRIYALLWLNLITIILFLLQDTSCIGSIQDLILLAATMDHV